MKKLGFGFMRLPLLDENDETSFDYEKINKMVDIFIEKGCGYFDTAAVYHDGLSEEAIRKSIVERYPRGSFTVATKQMPSLITEEDEQQITFNEQLERCGLEYFDYYLVHNIGVKSYRKAKKFNTFEFVQQMKAEGKIKNIGMSFHDTPEFLDEVLTAHPELDFVQLQINYADWESPGIQSRRCYEVARKHNKPIVVMEPVKGGHLANLPPDAEKLMKDYSPAASIASWAIRFAAGLEGVLTVLSGMTTVDQMIDNIAYMENFLPLDREEMEITKKAADIYNASPEIPCTACRYCVEGCQQNIPIPDYFSLYNDVKRTNAPSYAAQFAYYGNLAATRGKASDCIECGKCEEACPQKLKIVACLKDVATVFGK